MRIKKGDTVKVIAGKDRGKTGKVSRALPEHEQVIVDGVNIQKRHKRGQQANKKGGIIEVAAPIHVSNVSLVDPQTGEPTRVGISRGDDGKPRRVAKKSGAAIDA